MKAVLCKRCKHKFTLHDVECKQKRCKCKGFVQNEEQLLIVEHKITHKINAGKKTLPVYKSQNERKYQLDENSELNKMIWFEYNPKTKMGKWHCRLCTKTGTWKEMRYHGHADPRYYGLDKREKKILEEKYNIIIVDKSKG